MTWKPGQAGLVTGSSGYPFIVKNHFELKNGQRVLFEGNVLDNVWEAFSQSGFPILLTPKNQAPNLCPLCRVTDVTIRYNKVSHVAGVLQIANMLLGNRRQRPRPASGTASMIWWWTTSTARLTRALDLSPSSCPRHRR